MLRTCSWLWGEPCWRPPQAHVKSAAQPATIALCTRQFGIDPPVELTDHVLLRHDDPANMGRRVQSTLIELACFGVFRHYQVREFDDVAQVECRIRQRLRRKQILDAKL